VGIAGNTDMENARSKRLFNRGTLKNGLWPGTHSEDKILEKDFAKVRKTLAFWEIHVRTQVWMARGTKRRWKPHKSEQGTEVKTRRRQIT